MAFTKMMDWDSSTPYSCYAETTEMTIISIVIMP